MSMAMGSKLHLEPGSWAEIVYDIAIGIAVGAHHSLYFVTRWWYLHLIQPILTLLGWQGNDVVDLNQKNQTLNSLKVIAVGYGRTGTVSF